VQTPAVPAIRLDQWLWAARWFKTRSLAKTAIEAGRVTLDGQAIKPSRPARIGDRLEIVRAGERHEVEVLGLSDRRGTAVAAQALYVESEASRTRRLAERERRRLDAAGYQSPGTKPDKRARRLIRALGDLDAL
jgi:ribosome-associated heat shock protein Hsp15